MRKSRREQIKSKIFYARTYRHLKPNFIKITAYYLLFALPCLFVFLSQYSKVSKLISEWCLNIISVFIPRTELNITSGEFLPYFGNVFYVTLPNKMPSSKLVIFNIIAILLLLMVCYKVKDRAKPIAIYSTIALLIHLVTCIFFLVMPEAFPYSISEYSGLYMKQQVGIWLFFFTIASLVSGGISYSGISKFYMIFAVMGYSVIFGSFRYVVYLVFLFKASVLYMAILFFTFGTFFDFLYLVCIYCIYINILTKKFDDKKGEAKWQWA